MAKFISPASVIPVIEQWDYCADVRNTITNLDCGIHFGGSTYIFVDGHTKWLRVAQTLFPKVLWVNDSEPQGQACIQIAYMNRLQANARTRVECLGAPQ